MEEQVKFGNYLLSDERNKKIKEPRLKKVVGDWDIENFKLDQE